MRVARSIAIVSLLIVSENIALLVTGKLDLESDWDAYLAELDKIGIDRYLKLVQGTYDRDYR